MIIQEFSKVSGKSFSTLDGTVRYGYSIDDFADFEEIYNWNGDFQGNILILFDTKTNQTYIPFKKQKNIGYDKLAFINGLIYFLQYDFTAQKVNLFECEFGNTPRIIKQFDANELNPDTLKIIGENVSVVSTEAFNDDNYIFKCHYPDKFELFIKPNQFVLCIGDDKVYISGWIEEGVVDEEITKDYKYYNKLYIMDKKGNLISERLGSMSLYPDGIWRIS